MKELATSAVELLRSLISTPRVSRNEQKASEIVASWLQSEGISAHRALLNVYALANAYDASKPTLMLNSHIDTVAPSSSYTRDPHSADIEGDILYGIGSNDAGASVVSLCTAFTQFVGKEMPFNLLLALSVEEEVSGIGGMRALLPHLQSEGINVDAAIVGEPTGMNPAIGERGLLVLDGVTHGKAGHAARNEGDNALYKAIDDIDTLRNFAFPRTSSTLGPIKVTVTQIEAGKAHNVIPDICKYVVDVRTTDAYTNPETVELLQKAVKSSTLTPRSTHLQASAISAEHPLVRAAQMCGGIPFVSPTMSDQALMHFPTMKIGPGDSARSHTANEYIRISEIEDAIEKYTTILNHLIQTGI